MDYFLDDEVRVEYEEYLLTQDEQDTDDRAVRAAWYEAEEQKRKFSVGFRMKEAANV